VGLADGVYSGEGDHVIGVDALGSEKVQHLEVVGEWHVLEDCDLIGEGHAPIMAADKHREVDPVVVEEFGCVSVLAPLSPGVLG
jgi:hypothetical protein